MGAEELTVIGGVRFTVRSTGGSIELAASAFLGEGASKKTSAKELALEYARSVLEGHPFVRSYAVSEAGRIAAVPSEKWIDAMAGFIGSHGAAAGLLRFPVTKRAPEIVGLSDTPFMVGYMLDRIDNMRGKGPGTGIMNAVAGVFALEFVRPGEGARRTERFAASFLEAVYGTYLRGETISPRRHRAVRALLLRLGELYIA